MESAMQELHILADIPITRRLTVCHVLDGRGTLRYTADSLLKAAEWVRAQGQDEVMAYYGRPEVELIGASQAETWKIDIRVISVHTLR
jgi:hypothetical protein